MNCLHRRQLYSLESNKIIIIIMGNFACFLCHLCFVFVCFFKLTFSKTSFRNTIRVSNSLDPDQAQCFVGQMTKVATSGGKELTIKIKRIWSLQFCSALYRFSHWANKFLFSQRRLSQQIKKSITYDV